ncbi:acyl carrier protein [Microvirga sp. W0021]|uniref:Acyl carrier protein n=1 Tax=Hohaiivirga grylli TaxID=3133970 RepID=A0ABV0BGF6_9HYPH
MKGRKMKNYIDEAKEIISVSLFIPKEDIDENATIHAIKGLDSLSFETLVLELEKRLGRHVRAVELVKLQSVKDLAALLESK